MALTYYQMAERCIAVLFLMAGEDENAPLEKEEFFRRCNELKVFEMDDKKFHQFKYDHLNVAKIAKQGDVWPKRH